MPDPFPQLLELGLKEIVFPKVRLRLVAGVGRLRWHALRAVLRFNFALQTGDESLVAFARHDSKDVDSIVVDALPGLIDWEPDTAAHLLPAFSLRSHLAERADLENVGIVPALAQGAMGEDEGDRLLE